MLQKSHVLLVFRVIVIPGKSAIYCTTLAMIDTIKLAYPLTRELRLLFDKYTERLQRISPNGEIEWEQKKVRLEHDDFTSSYSGLRIFLREISDCLDLGFPAEFFNSSVKRIKSLVFFEFSLQKWQSPSAYNNLNTTLQTDLNALSRWISELSLALNYDFVEDDFILYRVDLSRNFNLLNCSPPQYFRCAEIHFSNHPSADGKHDKIGYCLAHRSPGYLTKKIYWKGSEFNDVERKKRREVYTPSYIAGDFHYPCTGPFVPLRPDQIDDLQRMIRFEMEFRRAYLEKNEMRKIIDIIKLLPRFEKESKKYFTVPLIVKGQVIAQLDLSPSESMVIDMVRRFGLKGGKQEFLKIRKLRQWYNIKKDLSSKSIYLESLDNHEYRYHGTEIFVNPEVLAFQFEESAYSDDLRATA